MSYNDDENELDVNDFNGEEEEDEEELLDDDGFETPLDEEGVENEEEEDLFDEEFSGMNDDEY